MAKIQQQRNSQHYITNAQQMLTEVFISIVEQSHEGMDGDWFSGMSRMGDYLRQKIAIEAEPDHDKRILAYDRLWKAMEDPKQPGEISETQVKFLEYDAKITDLCRRARKIATSHIVEESDRGHRQSAEHFDYVLRTLKHNHATPEQVQELIDNNGVAWFSLTAHPTNPTSVEYTQLGNILDAMLDNPHAKAEDLEKILTRIKDTPIGLLQSKSPLAELNEVLPTLDTIYDSSTQVRDQLHAALRHHGYHGMGRYIDALRTTEAEFKEGSQSERSHAGAVGILIQQVAKGKITTTEELRTSLNVIEDSVGRVIDSLANTILANPTKEVTPTKPLVVPNLWVLGDGDGNPNQTAENLEEGIGVLRASIIARYTQDLTALRDSLTPAGQGLYAATDAILNKLSAPALPYTLDVFKQELGGLHAYVNGQPNNIQTRLHKTIDDLAYKADTFGFHYARLDIRHNATDIMDTVARLAAQAGLLVDSQGRDIKEDDFKSSDLQKIQKALQEAGLHAQAQQAARIQAKVNESEYTEKDDLVRDLQSLKNDLNKDNNPSIFSSIDNLTSIVDKQGLAFIDDSARMQRRMISEWLKHDKLAEKLRILDPKTLSNGQNDEAGVTAARVFGRLQVISRNPDMAEKLIVAETRGAHHALAALFALKASGNVVGKGANIDLVTLSESVPDLENLSPMLKDMLDEPIYREHLQARGKLIAQMAKSDTVRRAGRGAEDSQDEAVTQLFSLSHHIKEYYHELADLQICAFQGGGASLQRGGGKPSEVPHRHGLAALEAEIDGHMYGPSTLTVQGLHKNALLHPEPTGTSFMSSLISQGLHAAAKTRYIVSPRKDPEGIDGKKAREYRRQSNAAMRRAYPHIIHNPAIAEVLLDGPWVSVKLGNRSSRASKRGGKDNVVESITVEQLAPKKGRSLLAQRAISTEKLCTHSGTHLLSYISMLPGLQLLEQENALHYTYQGNKAERDAQRNTAMVMSMIDFNIAWEMMAGTKRPAEWNTIVENAQQFEKLFLHKDEDGNYIKGPEAESMLEKLPLSTTAEQRKALTLSWLEVQAYETARLNYIAVLGKEPPSRQDGFTLSSTLTEAWPDLARSMGFRERRAECGHHIEAVLTRRFNANPDKILTEREQQALFNAYITADATCAPVGAAMTMTAPRIQEHGSHKKPHQAKIRDTYLEQRTFPPLHSLHSQMIMVRS